ncbi:MAG: sigma 54-interacting transcriptional regulator [Desulfomonilaceae bacterium]|nr:sigma 54-interacting transcriptional regulator [Desulfomonilaceae bacterium]
MNTSRYRIHLVADDPVETAAFRERLALMENGIAFDVEQSHGLAEALRKAQLELFDMMVVDLSLPDSTGLNTFIKFRDLAVSIPVLVLVDSDERSLALEAERKGAQDYLVKGSWSQEMLYRTIKHSIERGKLLVELRAACNSVRNSEQKFKAFFESTPDAVYIRDENLRFTEVNPAMADLFNKKLEEIIGSTGEELFGKRAGRQIEEWDDRVLKGESLEQEHTRSINGIPMTFLDIRVPLRNVEGKITGVCCISRDITERRTTASGPTDDGTQYQSAAMRRLMEQAERIAATDGTVLLLGASGTGKDYLARWIHDHSDRAGSPYFALNCAALSPELAESELFGHEPGAFTGARGGKRGMLELAEGGTLLLNEIGELPLPLQSKLLTFLDTRSFLRVGGVKSVTVDARLMAATHRNLEEEVASKRFLEPLFHRLNFFSLWLPALRERPEDLPQLVDALMGELGEKMHLSKIPVVDSRLIKGLAAHNWPGNVRELKNVLERALMLWDGGPLDLKLGADSPSADTWSRDLQFPSTWTLKEVTDEVTKQLCMQALRRTKGNKKEAARILGTSRDALYRYITRFHIEMDLLG